MITEREIVVIIDYLASVEYAGYEFLVILAALHGIKNIDLKLIELENDGFIVEEDDYYWLG